jgi:hypothetical protein
MRLAQSYILGTVSIASACSGKVSDIYTNANGGNYAGSCLSTLRQAVLECRAAA